MDQAFRVALTAVCIFRSQRDAILWICGGMALGLGLGALYRYWGRPSPAVGQFGSVCGNGIAESISGRQLNPLELRVLTLFLYFASTFGKHHRESVFIGSIYGGGGWGLDLFDWLSGNKPETKHSHAACSA